MSGKRGNLLARGRPPPYFHNAGVTDKFLMNYRPGTAVDQIQQVAEYR